MKDFRATHRNRKSGCYVMVTGCENGLVIYGGINGFFVSLPETEFNRDFADLSAFSGYAHDLPDPAPVGTERVWTRDEIAAAASPNGGYGKKELAALGVRYPPRRGWQEALLAGFDPNSPPPRIKDAAVASVSGDTELLKRVVIDIVEQGHGHLLHHIPGLLDRFGARLPAAEELAVADGNLEDLF